MELARDLNYNDAKIINKLPLYFTGEFLNEEQDSVSIDYKLIICYFKISCVFPLVNDPPLRIRARKPPSPFKKDSAPGATASSIQ